MVTKNKKSFLCRETSSVAGISKRDGNRHPFFILTSVVFYLEDASLTCIQRQYIHECGILLATMRISFLIDQKINVTQTISKSIRHRRFTVNEDFPTILIASRLVATPCFLHAWLPKGLLELQMMPAPIQQVDNFFDNGWERLLIFLSTGVRPWHPGIATETSLTGIDSLLFFRWLDLFAWALRWRGRLFA